MQSVFKIVKSIRMPPPVKITMQCGHIANLPSEDLDEALLERTKTMVCPACIKP